MKGFTGATGEPLFLCFFDAADNMAIGVEVHNLAKPRTFAKLYELPDSLEFG